MNANKLGDINTEPLNEDIGESSTILHIDIFGSTQAFDVNFSWIGGVITITKIECITVWSTRSQDNLPISLDLTAFLEDEISHKFIVDALIEDAN